MYKLSIQYLNGQLGIILEIVLEDNKSYKLCAGKPLPSFWDTAR